MTSLISWLDTSTDENSKMRELGQLFDEPETTDDLGMGLLCAISNWVFSRPSGRSLRDRRRGENSAEAASVSSDQLERALPWAAPS